jgi:hypothetical protein
MRIYADSYTHIAAHLVADYGALGKGLAGGWHMRIMSGLVTLVFLGCFAGCGSEMIRTNSGQPSQYGPQNPSPVGGTVRYVATGIGVSLRRENAYKQMFDQCFGKYNITTEGEKAGEVVTTQNPNFGTLTTQEKYWEITFQCVGGK